MLEQGNRLKAIELYRKANKSADAAKLLCTLAEEAVKNKGNFIRAKKLICVGWFGARTFQKRNIKYEHNDDDGCDCC